MEWGLGKENVAVGLLVMQSNPRQVPEGTATASENTAVGAHALFEPTTAARNVFVGILAGEHTTAGSSNTAVGAGAMQSNKTGSENTAVGEVALTKATAAANNCALGAGCLYELKEGENNTALGYGAGSTVTKGVGNVFVGSLAGPTAKEEVNHRLFIHNAASDSPLIGGSFPDESLELNATKLGFNKKTPIALIGENLSTGALKVKSSGFGFETEAQAKAALKFLEQFSQWAHEAGLTA